jgi:diguanylate cyclase (GGDEF)-like protein
MPARDPQLTLLEAARIVARGSELDAKLDALCEHVLSAADATAAAVYLYDPVAEILVPAAQAGLDQGALTKRGALAAGDQSQLVSRVARHRRAEIAESDGGLAGLLPSGRAAAFAALPLISADEAGDEDAEGVLVAAFAGAAPDLSGPENALWALADLCAVAVRQARLQNALRERADWIGRLASTDAVTGLANQLTFERMLELEIARATRQQTQLSVLVFDIEGFGKINEAGADAGDQVLRHVAATLAGEVRLVDTAARIGRDEFGLIAPGGGGEVAGKRVRDAVGRREADGQPISLRVGVAIYPAAGASGDELLKSANEALDTARRQGRGSIVVAGGS